MAHGILNHLTADDVQVYSAGITTHGVHPKAVAILAAIGIDISHHTSNKVRIRTPILWLCYYRL